MLRWDNKYRYLFGIHIFISYYRNGGVSIVLYAATEATLDRWLENVNCY